MYKIVIAREAVKYYQKVSTSTAARLDKCFAGLENEPFTGPNIKSLKGMKDIYRYRVGDLRVLFEPNSKTKIVYILAILPRGQAYK
jgi:mRNA interferase RelE/StbE